MPEEKRLCTLGLGTYSIIEAAKLTRSHPNTLYSWFRKRAGQDRPPVFESDYSGSDFERAISFFDLIDVKIAVELRRERISMQKIRKVYEKLKASWRVPHPFCYRRFYVSTGDVYAEIENEDGGRMLIEVLSDQGFDETVMKPFLRSLVFDEETERAQRWVISEGVVLDPGVRFGEPLVRDTRIPAEIVASSYCCEDGDERFTAGLYGVSVQDVRNAVSFYEKYGRRAA